MEDTSRIEKYIGGDRIITPAWIIVQYGFAFAGATLLALADYERLYELRSYPLHFAVYSYYPHSFLMKAFAALSLLISDVISLYIIISLISRRNAHFERTKNFYLELADWIERSEKSGSSWRIREVVTRSEVETGKKNVAGWAVLSIIPVINAIALPWIYHFLTRDYYRHDRYERLILDTLSKELNVKLDIFEYPDRDTVVYFLLGIPTFGLMNIYWLYTLFSDPNRHFREHAVIEEEILKAITTGSPGQ